MLYHSRFLNIFVAGCVFTRLWAADCSQFQSAANQARAIVQSDTTAINQLSAGFKLTANVLTDWEKMTVEQRRKLYQTAVLNLVQAAAAAPFIKVTAGSVSLPIGIASIGPGQAGALIRQLRSNGVENATLFNLLSGAATISGKPEAAKTGLAILGAVSNLLQTGIGAHDVATASSVPDLKEAASVAQLGLTLMGPAYAGYATALGAGSDLLALIQSVAIGSIAGDQIRELTNINTATLSELNRRIAKLKVDVENLKDSKLALDACEAGKPLWTTTLGREGFRVHWTDYPAQGEEARPLVITFRFDPADGRNVDVGNSRPISDGGKSGIPLPPMSGVARGRLPDSDFLQVPAGDYSVVVVVDLAYVPVPWGIDKQYGPGPIDQPREGNPLLAFHAKVLRGKTTDLFPRYSHFAIRPPEDRITSCVYRPPWKNFPAYVSPLQPLAVSQAAAAADNANSQGFGGPPSVVRELRYQRVYLGFDAFREEFPKCIADGSAGR
jgi:hypothetical protein